MSSPGRVGSSWARRSRRGAAWRAGEANVPQCGSSKSRPDLFPPAAITVAAVDVVTATALAPTMLPAWSSLRRGGARRASDLSCSASLHRLLSNAALLLPASSPVRRLPCFHRYEGKGEQVGPIVFFENFYTSRWRVNSALQPRKVRMQGIFRSLL
jgi:hypothetical protein